MDNSAENRCMRSIWGECGEFYREVSHQEGITRELQEDEVMRCKLEREHDTTNNKAKRCCSGGTGKAE